MRGARISTEDVVRILDGNNLRFSYEIVDPQQAEEYKPFYWYDEKDPNFGKMAINTKAGGQVAQLSKGVWVIL